jgi:F-type H+-transporting ATPase subunit epsilon
MNVEIITPDKSLFSGEAKEVSLPGIDGSLGILDRHAPLISALKSGVIKLKTGSEEKTFDINGGVVEVLNNKLIVLAE